MKRVHISLTASDLAASKSFYSAMLGSEPTFERDGYVQWQLDDPMVNFVIEEACGDAGLSHLGIQAQDEEELSQQFERVADTQRPVLDEGETTCCYARSTKNWVADPDGVRWETFLTHQRTGEYGQSAVPDGALSKATVRCC